MSDPTPTDHGAAADHDGWWREPSGQPVDDDEQAGDGDWSASWHDQWPAAGRDRSLIPNEQHPTPPDGDDGVLDWLGRDDWAGWPDGNGRARFRGRSRRRRRLAPLAAILLALLVLVPLGVGGFYGYRVVRDRFFPPDYSGTGSGEAIVHILPGDTATTVGQRLFRLGVVASARAFELAAEHSGDQTGLEPGYYRLRKHMKASLAFALLLNPSSRIQTKVTIPEGWRVSRIIATLAARSGTSLATYQRAARDTAALGLPAYAHGDLEGYLFPATYEIQPGMSAVDVLKAMVQRFDQAAASVDLTAAAARVGLTPNQVVTVASLVQAEGGRLSDYPKIAEVIYNRLDRGMKLQLDSTVLYALHTYGIMASDRQLTVQSPYNTYLHTGLPPGPIDCPGLAAIEAALHPATGDYLYFVTVDPKTGLTEFTASPTVFEQLRAELQRNLAQG